MRKRWTGTKAFFLVYCLLVVALLNPARAGAASCVVASGQIARENEVTGELLPGQDGALNWELDGDGTLTVRGKGAMSQNIYGFEWPWDGLRASIKRVVIEKGVTNIGWMAFKNCRNLKSVSIPKGVESIGSEAFAGCSSLKELTFPEGVLWVRSGVCQGCSNLKSVTIPHSVTEIGVRAFYGCSSLSQIKCDFNNWKEVGRMAFYGCSSLKRIKLVAGEIGTSAFEGCASLEKVTFGNWYVYIGVRAFKDCTSLRKVFFPIGVRRIDEMAFYGCSKLESAEFWGDPELGAYVFGKCKCTIYSRFFETYAKNRKLSHKSSADLKKPKNKIKVSDITITASESKKQTFLLHVETKDDTALEYYCSSNDVRVSNDGLVTVKKGFSGIARIEIGAIETADYDPVRKEIALTVRPTPIAGLNVRNAASRKLMVQWEKNGTGSGCQIQYSTDKKFKKGVVTKNINKSDDVSAVFGKLAKGKTYYIRIRTAKKTGKTSIYSEWSRTESVKITV